MTELGFSAITDHGSILDTELNSLADGARSNAGDEVTNGTTKHDAGILKLDLKPTGTPAAGSSVYIYILYEVDGDFDLGSSSDDPGEHKILTVVRISPDYGTSEIVSSEVFELLPFDFKILMVNEMGALDSSGSTVELMTWRRALET